ncbi:NAD(P)/FAD-dependent oxidoreductase [Spirochaeta lutea]|uniref:NAD(P)/FAD-dependent oxidoreductase n=1 Tax=Spirochaeta lutea TaxID=1480694 RepID=UPI00055B4378|nr:FAD-dependent oxidoreductase [Spirochaeta lutea]
MRELTFDAAVIGGGAAGMSAAKSLVDRGFSTAIIERDRQLGGILLQCIHNGFGLQEFKEELTGPEYAERWERQLPPRGGRGLQVLLDTTVMELIPDSSGGDGDESRGDSHARASMDGGGFTLVCVSPPQGYLHLRARAVVLATGCRERNRGNIRIPGTRPAGVYTAGLAQRMVNMEGYLPGKDAVIVGSGDIGLIMARRLTWSGCRVHGAVEIQPYPSGLTRNIVQCLNDFKIPLYLSHVVSRIHGKHRVEAVDITPLEEGRPNPHKTMTQECDTLLLSVGLIPSAELAREAGAKLNPLTGGPGVDSRLMTSLPGLFSAGNVLHVHDLVDYVSAEARRAGASAADYLEGRRPARQLRLKAGSNVRYLVPGSLDPDAPGPVFFRPMIVKNGATVEFILDGEVLKTVKKTHIQPSEMIQIPTVGLDLSSRTMTPDSVLEVRLQ